MKTKIILLCSIVMLSFACKHTKNTEKTTTTPSPTTYRAIVSFGSKGNGIDSKTIAALESYVITFGKKVDKTITFEKVNYGKEGEVDYCFALSELSKSKQDEFVQGLKNVTKSGQIVFVNENTVCSHKK
jgi:hypothetical protein